MDWKKIMGNQDNISITIFERGEKMKATIEEERREAQRKCDLAALIERQAAERKALEEELERTRPARALAAAYKEIIYSIPLPSEDDSKIN